jgi:small-conductance mechanosensitive channel
MQDPVWEARIQEAVLMAVLSLAPQMTSTLTGPPAALALTPKPLSAAALAEAEAAHIEQGLRLQEARMAQESWEAEIARKAVEHAKHQAEEAARQAAEHAQREAEKTRQLQSQLQQQLQALAAADAEAAQTFAQKQELLARESQAIAERLQLLQSTTGLTDQVMRPTAERGNLPPRLSSSATFSASTTDYASQTHGLAVPHNNAAGLAEPFNLAQQAPAEPQQSATIFGAPRPEEARQE